MCGEYGKDQNLKRTEEKLGRPHYHAIIFGEDFRADRVHYSTKNDNKLYTSESLADTWGKGYCAIGEADFDAAAYVARYIMKKITGEPAEEHYQTYDRATGEASQLQPEFIQMSRMPGIGYGWFKKYRHDLDKGFITMNGIKMQPPKYYATLYEREYGDDYSYIAERKAQAVDIMDPDNTLDRLRVKETIRLKKAKQLKRQLS